jgi:hypothetical protein
MEVNALPIIAIAYVQWFIFVIRSWSAEPASKLGAVSPIRKNFHV